jgi:hypothetical protein
VTDEKTNCGYPKRTETRRADSNHRMAASAGCPAEVWITVMPDKRAGRYQAYVDGQQAPLCVSRQPFLGSARKLVWLGHDPLTILLMRWAGANDWALRGQLGTTAKLTVDEHNGVFAEWKPYSRSAVPPGSVNSARNVPKGRAAEKANPENTAEAAFGPEHASAVTGRIDQSLHKRGGNMND